MYIFLAIQNIAIRAFYAMGDTKSPLIFSGVAVLLNAIISFGASKFIGINGLALGTTVSTLLAAFFLLVGLRKKIPAIKLSRIVSSSIKILISVTITLIATLILLDNITISMPIIRLIIATLFVFLLYFYV